MCYVYIYGLLGESAIWCKLAVKTLGGWECGILFFSGSQREVAKSWWGVPALGDQINNELVKGTRHHTEEQGRPDTFGSGHIAGVAAIRITKYVLVRWMWSTSLCLISTVHVHVRVCSEPFSCKPVFASMATQDKARQAVLNAPCTMHHSQRWRSRIEHGATQIHDAITLEEKAKEALICNPSGLLFGPLVFCIRRYENAPILRHLDFHGTGGTIHPFKLLRSVCCGRSTTTATTPNLVL
jgi:hypothetical protein